MASYLNKRSKVTSEAVTGDGDLVADVDRRPHRASPPSRKKSCLTNLRALKPEQRA